MEKFSLWRGRGGLLVLFGGYANPLNSFLILWAVRVNLVGFGTYLSTESRLLKKQHLHTNKNLVLQLIMYKTSYD